MSLLSAKPRAILLIDHGSRRSAAHEQLLEIARRLSEHGARKREPLLVEIAHMEIAQPDIATGFSACVGQGASEITVIPCLLSRGQHVTEHIPQLLRQAAAAHPDVNYRIVGPLAEHEGFIHLLFSAAELP